MKIGGKIVLMSLGMIMILVVLALVFGTMRMKEVKNFQLPSIVLADLKDGRHEGSCNIGRWAMTVEVVVQNHKIVSVDLSDSKGATTTPALVDKLNQKILEEQSCQVDAVAGATITSKAYMIAVADALSRAGKSQK